MRMFPKLLAHSLSRKIRYSCAAESMEPWGSLEVYFIFSSVVVFNHSSHVETMTSRTVLFNRALCRSMTGTRLLKKETSLETFPSARSRNVLENLAKLIDRETSCEFPGKHTLMYAPSRRAIAIWGREGLSPWMVIRGGSGRGSADLETVCKSPPTARRLSRSASRSKWIMTGRYCRSDTYGNVLSMASVVFGSCKPLSKMINCRPRMAQI
mmetsp:Transcript_2863/g.6757  ORF Transcript_2863/g.6757 Transcript_2863/m.6757 type:complete len:211 (+) Transcript_2863:382-1014(+)